MITYVLKLYITGRSARSERAISNLRVLCEEMLGGQFEVDIIDVLEHPEHAGNAGILVTPTLVKESPPPCRRVIGDLSDVDRVMFELDLSPDRLALALQPKVQAEGSKEISQEAN